MHLKDIIAPLAIHTNLLYRQTQSIPAVDQLQPDIDDSPLVSQFNNRPRIDPNSKLIELFIDEPELISMLNSVSTLLQAYQDV